MRIGGKLTMALRPVLSFFGVSCLTSLRPTPLGFLVLSPAPGLVCIENLIIGLTPVLFLSGVLGITSFNSNPVMAF